MPSNEEFEKTEVGQADFSVKAAAGGAYSNFEGGESTKKSERERLKSQYARRKLLKTDGEGLWEMSPAEPLSQEDPEETSDPSSAPAQDTPTQPEAARTQGTAQTPSSEPLVFHWHDPRLGTIPAAYDYADVLGPAEGSDLAYLLLRAAEDRETFEPKPGVRLRATVEPGTEGEKNLPEMERIPHSRSVDREGMKLMLFVIDLSQEGNLDEQS